MTWETPVWGQPPGPVRGIDINEAGQLRNLRRLADTGMTFRREMGGHPGYYSNNDQYGEGDAFVLSGILSLVQPRRIIEVGAGFSTAVMYETLPKLNNLESITIIEPYPERLHSLIELNESMTLIPGLLQDVNRSIFEQLEENDVLFIDSSHVAKSGSDVMLYLFEIFPILKSGVWVHIHDMFWPFEYPKNWIAEGRSWNELYMLSAWLTNNSLVSMEFFSHYLATVHPQIWKESVPLEIANPGGALWLRIL